MIRIAEAFLISNYLCVIRIRKSIVHALCDWDLQGRRPNALVVLDTDRNLAGLARQQAQEVMSKD